MDLIKVIERYKTSVGKLSTKSYNIIKNILNAKKKKELIEDLTRFMENLYSAIDYDTIRSLAELYHYLVGSEQVSCSDNIDMDDMSVYDFYKVYINKVISGDIYVEIDVSAKADDGIASKDINYLFIFKNNMLSLSVDHKYGYLFKAGSVHFCSVFNYPMPITSRNCDKFRILYESFLDTLLDLSIKYVSAEK